MTPFATTVSQKIDVYKIAAQMADNGLSKEFIADAVDLALCYEGAHDLLVLWSQEEDQVQREEIVADLQDEIDDHKESPKTPVKKPYVKFDDLDAIAKDVMKYKNALRKIVDKWGGINKLSKATGIPQPSLNRFFSSASMPRRTTLYRIADALKLSEDQIITEWVA